jgi:hypothetical protein
MYMETFDNNKIPPKNQIILIFNVLNFPPQCEINSLIHYQIMNVINDT